MTKQADTLPAAPLGYASPTPPSLNRTLLRQMTLLALPVLGEHLLHIVVGVTDTYLANHLPKDAEAATAAVGTITYVMWFMGLIASALGIGSTAIIARAMGAKHRRLANNVCGQSVTAALVIGTIMAVLCYVFARPIADITGLQGLAHDYALVYLRLLCIAMPFSTLMFVANSCLRGAGDTVTPAIAMVIVDVVNMIFTFGLCFGLWGLPAWGFHGIAVGTVIAYVAGGLLLFVILLRGRGGVRLHLHRLRPHWLTIKRLMRIGLPSGLESLLTWLANFGVVIVINQLDRTNVMSSAHINAIRIESFSFMTGFAFATAAATMVGQSLGMKDPHRATRSAYLAYAVGGGAMAVIGLIFIFLGWYPAKWLSATDEIARLTATCLRITGVIQIAFAAAIIFGGALRGAGDTIYAMVMSLTTIIGIRLVGVLIVGYYLRMGLAAIWLVLAGELFFRGLLIFLRFLHGGWRKVEV